MTKQAGAVDESKAVARMRNSVGCPRDLTSGIHNICQDTQYCAYKASYHSRHQPRVALEERNHLPSFSFTSPWHFLAQTLRLLDLRTYKDVAVRHSVPRMSDTSLPWPFPTLRDEHAWNWEALKAATALFAYVAMGVLRCLSSRLIWAYRSRLVDALSCSCLRPPTPGFRPLFHFQHSTWYASRQKP